MKKRVLIVDDDKSLCYSLKRVLSSEYEIFVANNSLEAEDLLNNNRIDLVLIDYRLGDEDGLDVLERFKRAFPGVPYVVMTAFGTNNTLIEAIKRGAEDFVFKPIEIDDLKQLISKHVSRDTFKCEGNFARIPDDLPEEHFVGCSTPIKNVLKMVANVAITDSPVLITGESGTGKELIANLIQSNSNRSKKPYVVLNCAAIPFELLESELFGYEKGAFSGAFKSKPGKFELADGGTIFLDEIGELPFKLQSKLLRFIQNGVVEKLGATSFKKVDVRIIAATNRDLKQLVDEGKFRLDLFYRLNVFNIHIPPLRERKEDISLLTYFYVKRYARELSKDIRCIANDVLKAFEEYRWPGNVRELQNVIRKAVVLSKNHCITEADLYFLKDISKVEEYSSEELVKWIFNQFPQNTLSAFTEYIEKLLIEEGLKIHKGNRTKVAEHLGISRVTLNDKINRYKIG
ncbi:MAG: sigma-54 dependent transcriptional regulator [Calditerrivibrio sp.]|nr:sigma-54 dependent transcriptional regulator [Calditerrivibrio sp.]